MSQGERWEFAQGVVSEILNGGDGSIERRFVELVGLNQVAVSNMLIGGGSLGWWGEDDEFQRVKEWLAGQGTSSGRFVLASRGNFPPPS